MNDMNGVGQSSVPQPRVCLCQRAECLDAALGQPKAVELQVLAGREPPEIQANNSQVVGQLMKVVERAQSCKPGPLAKDAQQLPRDSGGDRGQLAGPRRGRPGAAAATSAAAVSTARVSKHLGFKRGAGRRCAEVGATLCTQLCTIRIVHSSPG
jgi:hypothetical protein